MEKFWWFIAMVALSCSAQASDFFEEQGSFLNELTCNVEDAESMKQITDLGILFPNPYCTLDKFISWEHLPLTQEQEEEEEERPFFKAVHHRSTACESYDLNTITFEPILFRNACDLQANYKKLTLISETLSDDPAEIGISVLQDWEPKDFVGGNFSSDFFGELNGDSAPVVATKFLLSEIHTKRSLSASAELARKQNPTATGIEISAAHQMLDFYRHNPLLAMRHALGELKCEAILPSAAKKCFLYRDQLKMALTNLIDEYVHGAEDIENTFLEFNKRYNGRVDHENIDGQKAIDVLKETNGPLLDFAREHAEAIGRPDLLENAESVAALIEHAENHPINDQKVYRFYLVKYAAEQVAMLSALPGRVHLFPGTPMISDLSEAMFKLNEFGFEDILEGSLSAQSRLALQYRSITEVFALNDLMRKIKSLPYHNESKARDEFQVWRNSYQYQVLNENFQNSMDRTFALIEKLMDEISGNQN